MISSPRQPNRTNSGTLLYARGGTKRQTSTESAPPRICSNRGEKFVRAAYSRLTRRSSSSSRRGGTVRAVRGMFSSRGKPSFWFLCVIVIIFLSVALSYFEGSGVASIFGDVQQKRTGQSRRPSVQSLRESSLAPRQSPTTQRKQRPTPAPTPPTPMLSIEQYKEMVSQSDTTVSTNSFTTWLDFDGSYPSKVSLPMTNGSSFSDEVCDTRGTSWYPPLNATGSKDSSWQLRAPAFLLPGAAYSGTVYMAAALHQHPLILPARTKELQFFHDRPFRRYISPSGKKILVMAARERMYARDYDISTLKRNSSLISFDATPGYLFYSTLLPLRILCVEPWVKLVIMLRNPVDRVLEHYAASKKRGLQLTLEQWIDAEFALMRKTGLIAQVNSTKSPNFFGSTEEDSAWYNYTSATIEGGIGRSLYEIQIRQWIDAFILAGRDPSEAMLIVRTDHVGADPNREYDRILRFLQLPPRALAKTLPRAITHQMRPVSAATRRHLEGFFRPYNERLKRLLRTYGISSSADEDVAVHSPG
jgi:hypothetical protein